MRLFHPLMLAVLLLSSAVAGCLENSEEEADIYLNVNYQQNNGTIVHSYVDGDLSSTSNVELSFDFTNTKATNNLVSFGIDLIDVGESSTIDAKNGSIVNVEFSSHGMYTLNAFAVDEQGARESIQIKIRIELRMEWIETNTYDPKSLIIDPMPVHGGSSPDTILIHSIVENPELIDSIETGREVEFTWSLVDGNDDACQVRNGLVHEGDSIEWETIHFNTFQVHELRISYDSGQDYININQSVLISYNNEESSPVTTD